MKAHAVLDTNTVANLIAIQRIDVLQNIFGSVLMTPKVQEELMEAGYTRAWATKPPEWVKVQSPDGIDPKILEYNQWCDEERARGAGNARKIDDGEASAISLAKEVAQSSGHPAVVISDEGIVRDFLNFERADQKVFATNFFSIFCQGVDQGFVNINEREIWESQVRPGESEKHRDRVNELDAPSQGVANKGYTPMEKLDMFESYHTEQQQSQDHGQDHGNEH